MDSLLSKTLACMPLLLQVIDSIALLDMVMSFFQAVSGEAPQAPQRRLPWC